MSFDTTTAPISGSTRTIVDEILFEFAKTRGPRGYNSAEYAAVQDFAVRSAATTLLLALVGDRVRLDVETPKPAYGYSPNAGQARVVIRMSEQDFNELTSDPEIAPLAGVLREMIQVR